MKITIKLGPETSGAQMQALLRLAQALAGSADPEHLAGKLPLELEPRTEDHKPGPVKKAKAGKGPEAKSQKEPEAESEKEAPVKKSKDPSGVSIEDLRVAVSKKIAKYRKEIMAKMAELGAKNLSSVPDGSKKDLLDYIESLD